MRTPPGVRDHEHMTPPADLHVIVIDQTDPRLGRQCVQDPASRGFPMTTTVDKSTWNSRILRVYDPTPNPNQAIGNCTGCAKAMEGNTVGNRIPGRVLTMADADKLYSWATRNDPWDGEWPPTDTGSSGLAASKAARFYGLGGAYEWGLAGGADIVVQSIVDGRGVSLGTWWYQGMFEGDDHPNRPGEPVIEPTGPRAGGHQYWAHAFDEYRDLIGIRCWWGAGFRDAWIKRAHEAELLADDGDAHRQDMTP
jgi:hypothetical protein